MYEDQQNGNKTIIVFGLVFLILIGVAVGLIVSNNKDNELKQNSVSRVAKKINVEVGKYAFLELENIPDGKIVWENEDNSVAIVKDGYLTAVSEGKTTVTAKYKNRILETFEVTVSSRKQAEDEPEPVVEKPTEVMPESITLDKETLNLSINQREILTAEVTPYEVTDRTITWTSSDTSVAIVFDGEVVGIHNGTSTITATTNNGLTATCFVTVGVGGDTEQEQEKVDVKKTLSLNSFEESITVGGQATILAKVSPDDGTPVSWTSADTSIATVNNGVIVGKKVGNTTITASWQGLKTSVKVHVVSSTVSVSRVLLNPTRKVLGVGETYTMEIQIEPKNATNKKITWSSSNTGIVTVSNGKIKGIKAGTATITAKVGNKSAQATVVVQNVQPKSVQLNKTLVELKIGATSTVTATVLPSNAYNKKVTWKSNNTNVATVSNGTIKAVGNGETTVVATTVNGVTASVKVKVAAIPVTSVTLDKVSANIAIGKTVQVNASVYPSNATNKTVTWKSSNTSVATVSSTGLVKGIKVGKANITATAGGKIDTFVANVVNPVTSIKITYGGKAVTSLDTTIGTALQLNTVIAPSNATNKTVTWKSSNTKIATVDKDGYVKPKRTGSTTITATADGKSASITFTVKGHRIHFVNLGTDSGDCIILESNGHFALIDTGHSSTAVKNKVETYINNLGVSTFDFMITTHKHSDHIGSAEYFAGKYTIKKLYTKHYIHKDSYDEDNKANWEKSKTRYDSLIKKFGSNVVYVDTNSSFNETTSSSGYVTLGGMKVYFWNTKQRMYDLPSGTTNKYPSYYKKSYYAGSDENNNSLVNYVKVNGHNVILTGDMTNANIWKDLLKDRINGKLGTIAIFKVPHHGVYNCVGNIKTTASSIFNLTSKVSFYQVAGTVKGKTYTTVSLSSGTRRSCFNNLAMNNNTNAKKILCNAHYSTESSSANVYNLSYGTVTVSGGGLGKDNNSLCK